MTKIVMQYSAAVMAVDQGKKKQGEKQSWKFNLEIELIIYRLFFMFLVEYNMKPLFYNTWNKYLHWNHI